LQRAAMEASKYIEQYDLAMFGPVAIALQRFIGVMYGTFC